MRLRWVPAVALLFLAGCLLIPSDQETGNHVGNKRPKVDITAGAATSDSAGIDYKVNFQWRGADDDGVVVRFQYAIDDTTSEAAWRDTTSYSALLKMTASHMRHAPIPNLADTLNDWHVFYIRSVDNEYATSKVEKKYFNARTVAPTSRITFPIVPSNTAFGKTLVVDWTGQDLDSSAPDKMPQFYEYKLIRVGAYLPASQIADSLLTNNNFFLDTLASGDKTRWIRVPGTVHQRVMRDMATTGAFDAYVFAVRAVDEARAIEPQLEEGINWVKFLVTTVENTPVVTVSERFLGSHQWPGLPWGTIDKPLEVPAGTELRFKWVGDAQSYGSRPGNSNYALDIPDPTDERYRDPNGIGGWIGWGMWEGVTQPIVFDPTEDSQIHILYVRMRDESDSPRSETLCTIIMRVVAFRFDKTALLIDDDRITGYSGISNRNQDDIMDAFTARFTGRMQDYALDHMDGPRKLYTTSGQGIKEGIGPTQNTAIPFSVMTRYQALLWSFNFTSTGGGSQTGLWFHERDTRTDPRHLLSSYVAAGGKLFLFGGRPLSALVNIPSGGNAGGDYPKLPPQVAQNGNMVQFTDTNFVWKFLHVRNQIVGVDPLSCRFSPGFEHQQPRDGLVQCVTANSAYPDLYLDRNKWDPDRPSTTCPDKVAGGISDWEGILEGPPNDPDGGYTAHAPDAGLDTLYTGICSSWAGGPPTIWNGAIVAQRYSPTKADTLRGTVQGRVVMFLFQPYAFLEGPAIDAGSAAINWLMTGRDQ